MLIQTLKTKVRFTYPTPGPPCNAINGLFPLFKSPNTLNQVKHSLSSPGTLKGAVPVVLFGDVMSVALVVGRKEETKFENLFIRSVVIYI